MSVQEIGILIFLGCCILLFSIIMLYYFIRYDFLPKWRNRREIYIQKLEEDIKSYKEENDYLKNQNKELKEKCEYYSLFKKVAETEYCCRNTKKKGCKDEKK